MCVNAFSEFDSHSIRTEYELNERVNDRGITWDGCFLAEYTLFVAANFIRVIPEFYNISVKNSTWSHVLQWQRFWLQGKGGVVGENLFVRWSMQLNMDI